MRQPPPPSPSKFIKSDYKESDYESDFDRGKIITPVWRPSTANDSDSEPMYYKPIRPVLSTPASSRPQSQISDVLSPMPPTVFDQPIKFDGPPRPKFQPIEKPKQTSPFPQQQRSSTATGAQHQLQQQQQTIFKPTPVVPKPVAPFRPQSQQQQPQQFYTAVSGPPQHIATETRNQMHMRESTETSQRVVNMTQTKRIIQFDASRSSFEQHSSQQQQQPQQHPVLQQPQSAPHQAFPPPTFGTESPVSRAASARQPIVTTPTPTKFVPTRESRDTCYESSEVESTRIRPLWTPNASDTDEPQYRRVNAPRSMSQPRTMHDGATPILTPMDFDNKPVELPSKITFSAAKPNTTATGTAPGPVPVVGQHKTQTLDRYSSSKSTTMKQYSSSCSSSSSSATSKGTKPIGPDAFVLKPESPPQYGYFGGNDHQQHHQQQQHSGLKSYASDVAVDRSNQAGTPGNAPQAYRDESRVSQYGEYTAVLCCNIFGNMIDLNL